MATLADLFGMGGTAPGGPGGPVESQRDDYLAYQEACIMAGVRPYPPQAWNKAGQPKAPPPPPPPPS